MISDTLHALQTGLRVMRENSRLLLVGILVFVFPLLFVWITQSFFTTAYDNIDTAEKQRVNILHTSFSEVIKHADNYESVIKDLAFAYTIDNPDVSKIRIVALEEEGVRIVYSLDESLIGTYEESEQLYRTLPALGGTGSAILPTVIDGVRTWQVFRAVERDGEDFVIFTEHKFNVIDSVMIARRQQSYFGLTAIFLFLIALAYWLNRQISWEKNHNKLADQLKERDMFSNMIAHEFRSPLTAIKGYASFLEESKVISPEEKRYSSNIRVSAERLVILVNDFLEVARLQSGKMSIEKKDIDLRDVLTQVTEDLRLMAQEKGLSLVYEPPVQPLIMHTDRARMMQVITNIVSNAVKYTPDGVVELECTKSHGEVVITVKDTGTGISAEDQKKLFAPFMRVGGVDQTSTTGTGLGMWITKQLVALLDGKIGIESIKGIGTHVVITFKV